MVDVWEDGCRAWWVLPRIERRAWARLPPPAFVTAVLANHNTTTSVAATSLPSARSHCALPCERDRFTALSTFTRLRAATPTNRYFPGSCFDLCWQSKPFHDTSAPSVTSCLSLYLRNPIDRYPRISSTPVKSRQTATSRGLLEAAHPSTVHFPNTHSEPHTNHSTITATARRTYVASPPPTCMTAPRLCQASS